MRFLAFMACIAVQLSVFACEFNIHVHTVVDNTAYAADYSPDQNNTQDQSPVDHACHVHASHSFTLLDVNHIGYVPLVSNIQRHALMKFNFKKISPLIDHPPKPLRS